MRRSPGCFCRALQIPPFISLWHRDTAVAYTGKYPIPPHHLPTASARNAHRESEKSAGDYRENGGGNDRGALHLGNAAIVTWDGVHRFLSAGSAISFANCSLENLGVTLAKQVGDSPFRRRVGAALLGKPLASLAAKLPADVGIHPVVFGRSHMGSGYVATNRIDQVHQIFACWI